MAAGDLCTGSKPDFFLGQNWQHRSSSHAQSLAMSGGLGPHRSGHRCRPCQAPAPDRLTTGGPAPLRQPPLQSCPTPCWQLASWRLGPRRALGARRPPSAGGSSSAGSQGKSRAAWHTSCGGSCRVGLRSPPGAPRCRRPSSCCGSQQGWGVGDCCGWGLFGLRLLRSHHASVGGARNVPDVLTPPAIIRAARRLPPVSLRDTAPRPHAPARPRHRRRHRHHRPAAPRHPDDIIVTHAQRQPLDRRLCCVAGAHSAPAPGQQGSAAAQ
jgi:hypothetical protein